MAPFMPTVPLDSLAPAEGTHALTHACCIPRNSTCLSVGRVKKTKGNRRPVLHVHRETVVNVCGHQQHQAGVTRRRFRWNPTVVGSKPDNRGWILYLDKCSDRQADRYRQTVTDGQRCGKKQADRKTERCKLLLRTETGQQQTRTSAVSSASRSTC